MKKEALLIRHNARSDPRTKVKAQGRWSVVLLIINLGTRCEFGYEPEVPVW
jgi:hypothetical protein